MDRLDYTAMTDDSLGDFQALYERSLDDVYRYASRLTGGNRADTEELVQDTYLAVLQRQQHGDRIELTTGYLIVACRNRFLDGLRSGKRRRLRERSADSADTSLRQRNPDPPDPTTTAALAALSPEQRVALVLRYVDDLAVPDVARLLGRSVHATESLLARARAAMRAQLSDGAAS